MDDVAVFTLLTDCQPFFFGLIFAEDQLTLNNLNFRNDDGILYTGGSSLFSELIC